MVYVKLTSVPVRTPDRCLIVGRMVSRRSILMTVPLSAAAVAATPPAIAAAAPTPTRVPPDPAALPGGAAAVRGFTADLHRALSSRPGNLATAPYSVVQALAMTRAGARRTTAEEMDTVLHAPLPRPQALDNGLNTIDQILARYATGDGVRMPLLTTANAVWTRLDLRLRTNYLRTLARYYGTGAHPVDFATAPEAAREEINAWVSDRTNARIPDLLPSGSVPNDTNLILTNAIYLRAAWAYPFNTHFTAPAPFTRADGSVVSAQMMSGPFDSMGYQVGAGWRAVAVPYEDDSLAMAIVMPDDPAGLPAIEAQLNDAWLNALLTGFQSALVQLRLPKWSFRVPVALKPVLTQLGMPTAFSPRANLTGLTSDLPNLSIDNVVHETFIAVDEKGTEAAGATAIIIRPPSIPQGPQFFADRPFLFVIVDRRNGVPLFIGRVLDPTAD